MPMIPKMSDLFAGTAYQGPGAVCGVCSRPLSNPASVAAGIGPVCAGKGHSKTEKPSMEHRAEYTVAVIDGAIVIEDLDRGRSVTNDAENVVADLRSRGFDLTMPIIYRDTMGRWDGLAVRNGQFAGFLPLGRTLAEARARIATLAGDQA